MAFNKNKVMDAARKYVEKGQIDRAIKEYLRVVREDPRDVRVWLKIGDLYAKKGAKQDATETYLKVAKFYSEQGFYLKAVAVYKQILKLDARLVEVNLKLAELYRQLGLLSDAMQHFEMVAAHFHREGKTAEALATVRQLVDLDPENVATRIKLAELYSKEKMVEEAVTEFAAACEYLRAHNRQDDFIKVAERLLWHKPNRHDLNRELATLYLRRNDARRALQKLQVCFKAEPRDVETLALLAQAFQALDQKAKTVSVLKELARILHEDGKRAQAKDVHRKILMYVPDDPDSRAYLGESEPSRPPPPPKREPVAMGSNADQPHGRFAFTQGDIRARRPTGNPTGSMPLIDDPSRYQPQRTASESDAFAADFSLNDESSFDTGSIAGELHSDEIVKILTETDVYVKYGLHQKAIDHLKKVFDLDPLNVEAREQLKDIYVSQGREREAIEELMRLAEMAAGAEPERAELYVREILGMDGAYQPAFDLVQRYGLDVAGDPGIEILDDFSDAVELDAEMLSSGGVAEVDEDEIDFGDISFDSEVHELPPELTPEPIVMGDGPSSDSYEFDLDEVSDVLEPADRSGVTVEVSVDQVEAMVSVEEDSGDELDFDSPQAGADFDYEDAQAFDADLRRSSSPGIELAPLDDSVDDLQMDTVDGASPPGPQAFDAEPIADVSSIVADFPGPPRPPSADQTLDEESSAGGSALEDDLDEADFFVSQGLYGEATDILHGLLARYPDHPLVTAKLNDVQAMAAGGDAADELEIPQAEISSSEPAPEPFPEPAQSRPAVLLEKPIEDEDADTHYDLGLAYKEMGLYGEAIGAFNKVIHSRGREVQCHLMIGLCHREQGQFSEAVHQFKSGLHVNTINDRERYSLYYEIAATYEAMNDPGEALYFFEMVSKKDPEYRDVADRIANLKANSGRNGEADTHRTKAAPDDADAALDSLLAEPDLRIK